MSEETKKQCSFCFSLSPKRKILARPLTLGLQFTFAEGGRIWVPVCNKCFYDMAYTVGQALSYGQNRQVYKSLISGIESEGYVGGSNFSRALKTFIGMRCGYISFSVRNLCAIFNLPLDRSLTLWLWGEFLKK